MEAARRRWSADPCDPLAWRNVSGKRSRQLLRTIAYTDAVHGFIAQLAEQARASRTEIVQLDPPRRAPRDDGGAARPYLRYYVSQRPTDDHGVQPVVLVVFDDELAAQHFLRVAHGEIARACVDVLLLVSDRAALPKLPDRSSPGLRYCRQVADEEPP